MGYRGQNRQFVWRAAGVWFAAAAACAFALPAAAQDAPEMIVGTPLAAPVPGPSSDGEEAAAPLSAEDNAIIDKALAADPASFANTRTRPLRLPALASKKGLDLARTDRPDGSGTVVIKKPLATEWDVNIGADLGLAADPARSEIIYSRDNPLGVTRNDRSTGAAWANLGVTDYASVDARVDPNNEQSRVGTTFKHSLPIGDQFAVRLQSRATLTENHGAAQASASDIPLRVAPANDPGTPVPRIWGNENVAKLDILSTGTTFGAGLSATSTDPVTHNTLSAEQKIYGPLGLATTVTDIGRAGESKTLSARMKLTW